MRVLSSNQRCVALTTAWWIASQGTALLYPEIPRPLNASAFARTASAMVDKVARCRGRECDDTAAFVRADDTDRPRSSHELQLGVIVAIDQVLQLYTPNATEGADNAPLAARLMSDLLFDCGTRQLARRLQSPTSLAWLYRFNQRAEDDETPPTWGVTHGSEVPFVFDRGDWVGTSSTFRPPEATLARDMGAMWTRFASLQQPYSGWPAYTNASEDRLVLHSSTDGHFATEVHSRARFCDFWDAQPHE